MWGVYICSGPGWALRVKVRNDWEEVFFERSLQPTGCLCLLFRCITRGETSNSAKGQSVIFHPNFRSVWCKHPLSCLRPLRTLSRCQLSPESRDERCHHYYLCNNTDFKMLNYTQLNIHISGSLITEVERLHTSLKCKEVLFCTPHYTSAFSTLEKTSEESAEQFAEPQR